MREEVEEEAEQWKEVEVEVEVLGVIEEEQVVIEVYSEEIAERNLSSSTAAAP